MGSDASRGRGTVGVSGLLKSVVKHRSLGVEYRVSCAKDWLTNLNDTYVTWRVLRKELLLWDGMIAASLKFLVALFF